jgi:hypothetical protein
MMALWLFWVLTCSFGSRKLGGGGGKQENGGSFSAITIYFEFGTVLAQNKTEQSTGNCPFVPSKQYQSAHKIEQSLI